MKTIIRNFLSVLRRFKMAAALNVAGLAVAFAAFIVILIQVNFERNFDRCYPTSGRIFRVDLNTPGTFGTILPRGFIEAIIPSSPHIEAGTLVTPNFGQGGAYLSVEKNGERSGFKEIVTTCHPTLPKMFGFTILEGDPDCLKDPEKVIIPESLAMKLFGEGSAVGKPLLAEETLWTKSATNLTVGAVYKDLPANTQLRNVIYTAIDPSYNVDNFEASNWVCYLLLDDPATADDVADNFNKHFDFKKIGKEEQSISLVPLTGIYYRNETQDGGTFRSGNKEVSGLLFGIALLIIIVAAINFTNFSTALTPLRIKSINTQKVLGSSDALLRRALLSEAAIISLVAWLVSLFIVWGLGSTDALPFVEANLDLQANWPVLLLSGAVALLTGLIAGVYPSYYITSFPPALVLKGSFGLSPSGKNLRTALIGIQFVVSIVLIIGSSFVRLQNNYMRGFSLGFDKDQVAIVELNRTLYNKHHETYVNRLKEFSGIEDVAFAMEKVAAKDGYNTNGANYKGNEFSYFLIMCSSNFLDVMGIPVQEGRNFSKADELSDEMSVIFNKSAHVNMDMQAGDWLYEKMGRMIGFSDEVKFTSLRNGDNNIAFAVGNFGYPMPVSYIRFKAGSDIRAGVDHVRNILKDLDPSYPFNIEFYDQIFDQLYRQEENLRSLVTIFSILAIIISLVGVFGLVVFDTQYRRKEIGIRKVHGATVGEILAMFNKAYLKIVAICFVIAAPIAWFGVKKWLESFSYKTPVYWWVFLIALLIVAGITLLTVTFQNWKAANANPVNSIKSE
ncbi:ABC transporter permease [uncultured Parabacteroides sp.]|jgi:putative ABC transport system permease protein|uniref:ABC transporter permease n=1 Tax=uncultured Parabacteroides sp. TaxID=512312 RepID=UPI0025E005E0|nr:ABC transporter permease [uncultured Parabacteroides sp.]